MRGGADAQCEAHARPASARSKAFAMDVTVSKHTKSCDSQDLEQVDRKFASAVLPYCFRAFRRGHWAL